jgi:hypothetical protein
MDSPLELKQNRTKYLYVDVVYTTDKKGVQYPIYQYTATPHGKDYSRDK